MAPAKLCYVICLRYNMHSKRFANFVHLLAALKILLNRERVVLLLAFVYILAFFSFILSTF